MQPTGRSLPPYAPPSEPVGSTTVGWTVLALIAALVASLGSAALSLDLPPVKVGEQEVQLTRNLKACPLCYYQRMCAFGAFGVLLIGLFTKARRTGAIGVIALPLAIAGVGVAGFHNYLEYSEKMECPKGLLDIGTAPQQSLAALGVLTLLLLIDAIRNTSGGSFGVFTILLAVIVGGGAAYGGLQTTAMPPPPSKEAYEKPPEGCRPLPNPHKKADETPTSQ
jgi:disulfide bond formation protein DsbB